MKFYRCEKCVEKFVGVEWVLFLMVRRYRAVSGFLVVSLSVSLFSLHWPLVKKMKETPPGIWYVVYVFVVEA